MRDGGPAFEACLEALAASTFSDWDLLVVDDDSNDGSDRMASARGVRVIRTPGVGPAAARNRGAALAKGDYLFFLDADCEVHSDTLETAAAHLRKDPGLDALFGSYDDQPAAPGLVSQWKNLFHHYVHQQADGPATTFWAGCGTVRRQSFRQLGGFDERRFPRPSIEDIDLGYRLSSAGGRIRLVAKVEVTHHKRWTLWQLVRTDVVARGIPWTQLVLAKRGPGKELNLDPRGRAGLLLGTALLPALALAPLEPRLLLLGAALLLGLIVLNRRFYRFLARRRGLLFALASVPLHVLYCVYSTMAFCLGLTVFAWKRYARSGAHPSDTVDPKS